MISTGMIFQYDNTQGTGLLMLLDGEKKEFSTAYWIDTQNDPAIGQKIFYEENAQQIKIRVATKEDEERVLLAPETPTEVEEVVEPEQSNPAQEFRSIDEGIRYFKDMGFNLVKDAMEGSQRVANLRMYTVEEFGEVTLEDNGISISVTKTLNGKPFNG